MSEATSPKAMPGVNLRVLSKIDGPVEGFETVIVEIDVPAGLNLGESFSSRRRNYLCFRRLR